MQSGAEAGTFPGVVLAGGAGRRMGGRDKALVALAGRPMVGHVIDRLTPQLGALALNAGGDPARFARFGLPVLPDPVPGRPGPLAGVLAAMLWAGEASAQEAGAGEAGAQATGAGRVLTVATDTPFLPGDLVARLAAVTAPVVLAARGGRLHPTVGLWSVELAPALRAALAAGQRKLGAWALAQGAVTVAFDKGADDPFFNVNTPEDMETAEAMLAGGAG